MDRSDVAEELGCKVQRTTVWKREGKPIALVVKEDLNPKVHQGRITFGSKDTTRAQADHVHGRIVEVYVHSTPNDYRHLGRYQITVDASPAGVRQAEDDAPHRITTGKDFHGTLHLTPFPD